MNDERTKGYAAALFEIARAEGALDAVTDELFRFARTLERENRLRDALTDETVPADHRVAMVSELLGTKASPVTANMIALVVRGGRGRELPAIIDAVVALAATEQGKTIAEARSAVPLDDAQGESLRRAIQTATGKDVEVKVIVDPAVIGGLVVRVGNTIFDASVRHRLQLAKEHFAKN